MGTGSLRRPGVLAAIAASAALVAACGGGGSGTSSATGGATGGAGDAQKGGKLTLLTQSEQIQHLDPQRNYTGVDLAFAGSFLQRSLTSFTFDPDPKKANVVVGDLATDAGKPSNGGKTWAFTLRDGVAFEDGSPITCADVKYGVSRTFATDVITDGPQYAVSLLDVPKGSDGSSVFKGPYKATPEGTAAFDKAVTCSADNKTITFNLATPSGDFNQTTTLLSFSPVPKAKDTGEKYDDTIVSSGPYKVQTYTKGQKLVLVRNDKWTEASDPIRKAYPDSIEVNFKLDPGAVDQRLIADAGADQAAATHGDPVQPQNLATIFETTGDNQAKAKFQGRAFNDYDVYVRYYAINMKKVPVLEHRKAIVAAADREGLRRIAGGNFAGDLADGIVKPNIGDAYQPTGMFDTLLGKQIGPNGDPEYAKQLIQQSGKPMPPITLDYAKTPVNDKAAALLQSSLAKAGITIKLNPLQPGTYYGIVLDPKKQNEITQSGWGADWPNASTVIPELLTPVGGFNLSRYDDKAFTDKVIAARGEADPAKQATLWAELSKEAMAQAPVIPTRFGKVQYLTGSKVGNAYIWGPYGSLPYAVLYVKK
jgi:peptide/nickel transport system substrate-binding protein